MTLMINKQRQIYLLPKGNATQTLLLRKSVINVLRGFPWKPLFGHTNQKPHSYTGNKVAVRNNKSVQHRNSLFRRLKKKAQNKKHSHENEGTNQVNQSEVLDEY